jgi:hypothetical protein
VHFFFIFFCEVMLKTQKPIRTKVKGKGLDLTSKQKTKQGYLIQKQKHNIYIYINEMCKTNMKADIYYVNVCKHEHVKNITKLWCKIVLKISVEQTKGNERSYSYLYFFGNLTQTNFQRGFYVCIK